MHILFGTSKLMFSAWFPRPMTQRMVAHGIVVDA